MKVTRKCLPKCKEDESDDGGAGEEEYQHFGDMSWGGGGGDGVKKGDVVTLDGALALQLNQLLELN